MQFDLPVIETTADLPKATHALLQAVAAGELTPSEAADISKSVDAHVRAIEATDLHERLARLEEMTQHDLESDRSPPSQAGKGEEGHRFDGMSEEQLNEEINLYLGEVCQPYGTVNATAEALKVSPDRLDQEVPGTSNGTSAMWMRSGLRGGWGEEEEPHKARA